jgi:hypothetical protein
MGPRARIGWLFLIASVLLSRGGGATEGGDSKLQVLGFCAERSAVLVSYMPGGENEVVEVWAFNLQEQVLEKAVCDECRLMTPTSPYDRDEAPPQLTPTERGYQRVLDRTKQLRKLDEVSPQEATAAGLSFACEEPQRRRCTDDVSCLRQACTLAVADGESKRIAFDASSKKLKVRLYRIPGFPKAALAWIIHRGIVEFGYREDRIVFLPALPRKPISMQRLAAKYFAPARRK